MPVKSALVPLSDMRAAIRRIERYTKGKDLAAFRRDDLVVDAVERCLEIISEASRRLPEAMKAEHPDVPWRKVAALGNVFRHEYDAVSMPMVWEIVQEHLPPLKRALGRMSRTHRSPRTHRRRPR
jgi:uncharacterized protein with HEPN domain